MWLISQLIALFVTFPLLVYMGSFLIVKIISHSHRLAVWVAISLTTIFLLIGCQVLLGLLFGNFAVWWMYSSLVVGFTIFVIIYRVRRDELLWGRVTKALLKFTFLMLLSTHFVLFIYGMTVYAMESMGIL